MKNSILVLPEEAQREQFDAFQRKLGISEGSTLDYIAVTAAFLGGKEWLEMVLHAIFQNACMLRETLSQFPEVVVSPLEGTYLMWIDLAGVVSRETLHDFVQNACHLAPDYGHWFFPEGEKSDTHIRLNLAAPQQTIQRAAEQLETVLKRVLQRLRADRIRKNMMELPKKGSVLYGNPAHRQSTSGNRAVFPGH